MSTPHVTRWKGQRTYRLVWQDPETGARRRHDTGCATRVEAEAYLKAWLAGVIPGAGVGETGGDGAGHLSVDDLCEQYLDRRKVASGANPKSQRDNLVVIRRMIGARSVGDLVLSDLERVRDELIRGGRKPPTARRYLGSFVAAVNWGVKAGLVSEQVRAGMTRGFTLPSEGEAHTLYLTQTQRDQMFALCEGILSADWDRHWRAAGAVCLALGTAARQEAILTLKWSQVDFDAGVIDYREPDRVVSNKRRVAVPMSEEVRKVLKLLEKKTGASKSGLVLGHAGTVRSGFDRIRHQTGVPWCRFRTLRTTWASLAAQRGVDLFIIGEVLGDDIETVRKHYAHLHPTHLRSAFQ